MNKARVSFLLGILALSGCASSSGVLPEGRDSFLISREGGSAFVGVTGLKSDAYRDADQYCTSNGKKIIVTSTNSHPGGFGKYPLAEVHFMCLDAADPQFSRVKMASDQAPLVQINNN